MKINFLKCVLRISSVLLIIGFLLIMVSVPLSEVLCTTVLESGEAYRVTEFDSNRAFNFMLSFLASGCLIGITGTSGLLMGGYLWFSQLDELSDNGNLNNFAKLDGAIKKEKIIPKIPTI